MSSIEEPYFWMILCVYLGCISLLSSVSISWSELFTSHKDCSREMPLHPSVKYGWDSLIDGEPEKFDELFKFSIFGME